MPYIFNYRRDERCLEPGRERKAKSSRQLRIIKLGWRWRWQWHQLAALRYNAQKTTLNDVLNRIFVSFFFVFVLEEHFPSALFYILLIVIV
jgi:hypothetical protein